MLRTTRIRAALLPVLLLLPPAAPWVVDLRGFGPIRFGMTIEQASQALEAPITPGPELGAPGCSSTAVPGAPAGALMMLNDGRVVRVDIDAGGVYTRSGAHVGMTEDRLQELYGDRLTVEGHPYNGSPWHYLVLHPTSGPDSAFGMVFETDGDIVRSFRAGRYPEVGWIEGCV